MPNKLIFALSLCRKAGKLAMGFDSVKENVVNRKAKLVICASDISEGTRRRVEVFCENWVECVTVSETQFDLLQISKKPTGVFAVLDPQLANLCKKNLENKEALNGN